MDWSQVRAAILDTDGVITDTATLHARAWQQMFDQFLDGEADADGNPQAPFDIESDYLQYVDGKPRYDGVRSFLKSRGIELPEGDPDDAADQRTICGLGNRKNQLFHQLLEEGVEAFADTVEQIHSWKQAGWKVGVFSSSRNCESVLRAAGVLDLFDAKVDGNDLQRLKLSGKPAPDMLLEAARQLEVEPSQAIVLEDAVAGVQAGRAGGFAEVVGVGRDRSPRRLLEAGADVVVQDVRELQSARYCPPGEDCLRAPASATDNADWLAGQLRQRQLALFLDYDGTLTPIVRRPEDATLDAEVRSLLRQLAEHCTLAIVSGRDRRDAENMVQVDNLIYAGSHGYDIRGPEFQMQHEQANDALPELDEAERQLAPKIEAIEGARVERKLFAIAVHYREVEDEDDIRRVGEAVDEVCRGRGTLRKKSGKKIFELQPDVPWDKGRAVLWLIDALRLDRSRLAVIYIGDDVTDEDAFRALRRRGIGIGIRVGSPSTETEAVYYLRDCDEVRQFLDQLLNMIA